MFRGERAACAFHSSAANSVHDLDGDGIRDVDINVGPGGGDEDPPISLVSSLKRELRSL